MPQYLQGNFLNTRISELCQVQIFIDLCQKINEYWSLTKDENVSDKTWNFQNLYSAAVHLNLI